MKQTCKSCFCFFTDSKQHKAHELDMITLRKQAPWSYMTWLLVTLTWLLYIGESLFILFASLTYAYHYKNYEYWKGITVLVFSENLSPIHLMVSEKFSSKNSKFSGDVRLTNLFAIQQFRSFWCLIFPSILLAKSWKLQKLLNLISSFNFCI